MLATDGLWEFLSNKEVIKIIAPFYLTKDIEGASDKLLKIATKKWEDNSPVIDDITFIILFFYLD